MQRQDVIRTLFFVVFFGVGAAAFSTAILCEELIEHYHATRALAAAQEQLEKLKALNADYDALIEQLQSDPELLKRIAPVILGTEAADPNIVFPKINAEQLEAVRKTLKASSAGEPYKKLPQWLERSTEPRRRLMLLVSGALLILVSLICFGPAKQAKGS